MTFIFFLHSVIRGRKLMAPQLGPEKKLFNNVHNILTNSIADK